MPTESRSTIAEPVPELMTVSEAGAVLKLTPRSVYSMISTGKLRRVKIGRQTRVFTADVRRLIAEGSR